MVSLQLERATQVLTRQLVRFDLVEVDVRDVEQVLGAILLVIFRSELDGLLVVGDSILVVALLHAHLGATGSTLLGRLQLVRCSRSGEVNLTFRALNAAEHSHNLVEHIYVAQMLLYNRAENLIQFVAVGSTRRSEHLIHIILVVLRTGSVLVCGIGSLFSQDHRYQLVVRDVRSTILVRISFVTRVTEVGKLLEYLNLRLVAHTLDRLLEPLVCRILQRVFLVEVAVVNTLQAKDICLRVLRVVTEIFDTTVVELEQQLTQFVVLLRILGLRYLPLYQLITTGVDSLVGVRAGGINLPPGFPCVGILFVLDRLVEQRHVNHTLLGYRRLCLLNYRFGSRLGCLLGFLSQCKRRKRCNQCQGNNVLFHNTLYFKSNNLVYFFLQSQR